MILVTGATGNVGRELVPLLAAAGHPVRVFVRDERKFGLTAGVECAQGDLDQPGTLASAMRGIETVYIVSPLTQQVSNVLAAAKASGVRRIVTPWPGISADKVEQLVTRKIEQAATGNSKVDRVESTTQDNISVVTVRLLDSIQNTQQEFQDIGQRLNQITDLPQGAGPITWISDFGDTAALMLTVASPPVPDLEINLRARGVREAIEKARREIRRDRATVLYCYPARSHPRVIRAAFAIFAAQAQRDGVARDVRPVSVGSCSGIDFATTKSDDEIRAYGKQFIEKRLQEYEFHPDAWGPIIIRDPQSTKERIAEIASDRYSYRQLDDFTDLIQRTLQRVPEVAKVQRAGVLPEEIYLEYSDDRLAAFKLAADEDQRYSGARNMTAPGGCPDPIAECAGRPDSRIQEHERNRRRTGWSVAHGVPGVSARPSGHIAWVPDPGTVPELHGLSRGERQLASQPCDHAGRADAIGGADRQIRRSGGQSACRACARNCLPTLLLRARRTSRGKCKNLSAC